MKRFLSFVLSNLDTLIAIAICVIVAILGVLGRGQSVLIPAIVGVLGLLAYGHIRDRIAREELSQQIQQLKSPPNVGDILKDRKSYAHLTETIASAQLICFVGPSLTTIFSDYAGHLYYTKFIEHGAAIQFVILDPDCLAVESAAGCMNEPPENLRHEIEGTILRVKSMLQPENRGETGSIELRLMNVNPNYSMVLIDPYKSHGKMFIEFIGYHSRLDTRPHIELSHQRDKEWFDYFLLQYDELRKNSTVHSSTQTCQSQEGQGVLSPARRDAARS